MRTKKKKSTRSFTKKKRGGAHGLVLNIMYNKNNEIIDIQTQDILANNFFQTKQFYFHQAWFIGALFVAILFMNRIVPRFWCTMTCCTLGKALRNSCTTPMRSKSRPP